MPMQPRPSAETLRPLRPSSRSCMMISFRPSKPRPSLRGRRLIDADQWLLGFSDAADAARVNSGGLHIENKPVTIVACDRNKQSTGGLRVKEQSFQFGADFLFVADHTLGEITVVVEAAGNIAGPNAVEGSRQNCKFL